MKLLTWIILLPLAALIIVFAVVNRELTTINLWPLPFVIDLPLFSVIFGGALVGIVWGGIAAWSAAGPTRQKARERAREVHDLSDENRRLKGRVEELEKDVRERNRAVAKAVTGGDEAASGQAALPGAKGSDAA
ncbi:MAG: LapA family protein [Rhodospirillales bacterium]